MVGRKEGLLILLSTAVPQAETPPRSQSVGGGHELGIRGLGFHQPLLLVEE